MIFCARKIIHRSVFVILNKTHSKANKRHWHWSGSRQLIGIASYGFKPKRHAEPRSPLPWPNPIDQKSYSNSPLKKSAMKKNTIFGMHGKYFLCRVNWRTHMLLCCQGYRYVCIHGCTQQHHNFITAWKIIIPKIKTGFQTICIYTSTKTTRHTQSTNLVAPCRFHSHHHAHSCARVWKPANKRAKGQIRHSKIHTTSWRKYIYNTFSAVKFKIYAQSRGHKLFDTKSRRLWLETQKERTNGDICLLSSIVSDCWRSNSLQDRWHWPTNAVAVGNLHTQF